MKRQVKTNNKVQIHPGSVKHIKKGHPWITLDTFSAKFPKREELLIAVDPQGKEIAVLLNDPVHKNIKARLWCFAEQTDKVYGLNGQFKKELHKRIEESIDRRMNLDISKNRDNFYLIFGEADALPGLFVQMINGKSLLIQYNCFFWQNKIRDLSDVIKLCCKQNDYKIDYVYIQKRINSTEVEVQSIPNSAPSEIQTREFGVNYNLRLGNTYDFGIYTDMSSIRNYLLPYFEKAESFLNLYSYTGAYSLYALANGVKEVVSVDLSEQYLDWLYENTKINDFEGTNSSMKSSVSGALKKLNSESKRFDLIVSDPPSASSDGKKTTSAFKRYEQELPLILNSLNKGGHAIIFLNTHSVNFNKFRTNIMSIIAKTNYNNKVEIVKQLKMSEDCPVLSQFPEGNYLKGLILKLKD